MLKILLTLVLIFGVAVTANAELTMNHNLDEDGNVLVSIQNGGGLAVATDDAPTYVEGEESSLSIDLSGNLRVTLGTLISGEDQTNNLIMTGAGVTRITTFSSVTSATSSSVTTVPSGPKTFFAQIVNATSETKAATLTIYGNWTNSTSNAIAVCTVNLQSTGSVTHLEDVCPPVVANYTYWFYTASVYTSASSAPLTVYAMY